MRNSKFIVSTAVAISAIVGVGAASAADLPARTYSKAPMAVAPVYDWTGFYIGGNVGAAFDRSNASIAPTSPTTCIVTFAGACVPSNATFNQLAFFVNSTGFNKAALTGGVQAGYNRQFDKFVVGIETDFNFTGVNNSSTISVTPPFFLPPSFFPETISHKLDWFGTIRGRVGFTPVDRLLLYVTGGLAYGRVASTTSVTFNTPGIFFPFAGSASAIRAGWTAGGGGEWAFADHWSAKLEYLYVDLGTLSYLSGDGNPFGRTPSFFQTNVTTHEHIVRVGLNYKFGGPVVAKY